MRSIRLTCSSPLDNELVLDEEAPWFSQIWGSKLRRHQTQLDRDETFGLGLVKWRFH
jgi:hypothetical protein